MVLGDIQVARAEQYCEQRQYQRHDQRSVLSAGAIGPRTCTAEQVDAEHDTLELQGDIRQYADQADQRYHHRQGLRLAIARGDKVGN